MKSGFLMKQSKPLTLIAIGLTSAVAAYLYATWAISRSLPTPVSGFNLMFTLPAIAVVLIILAWPIYRYRQVLIRASKSQLDPAAGAATTSNKPRPKRVDPFYAVRVLVLAKATAVASSIFIGWHLGVIFIQAKAPVIANGLWLNLGTLIGAVFAIVAALWVESICKIPDDSSATATKKSKLSGNGAEAALPQVTHD